MQLDQRERGSSREILTLIMVCPESNYRGIDRSSVWDEY